MDYEKMILREISKLEARISSLEKKCEEPLYKELYFSEDDFGNGTYFNKTFNFISNKVQSIVFQVICNITCQETAYFRLGVGGRLVETKLLSNGRNSFYIPANVDIGNIEIDVIVGNNSPIDVSGLQIKFSGEVDYEDMDFNLSVANFSTKSLILYGVNNEFSLYEYKGEDLDKVYSFNAKKAVLSRYNEDFLLGVIKTNNQLEIIRLNHSYQQVEKLVLDSQVLYLSGSTSQDGYVFYYVKNNKAYKLIIDENYMLNKVYLGFNCNKIYSSPNVENAFILCETSGNVSLIIED